MTDRQTDREEQRERERGTERDGLIERDREKRSFKEIDRIKRTWS